AGARIAEGAALALRLAAQRIELLGGAEAVVGVAVGEQPLRRLGVARLALALQERALVPGDAGPAQRLLDLPRHRLVAARAVGVLDAQHVGTAERLPQQVVVDRRARAADGKVTGGRRREAEAYRPRERRRLGSSRCARGQRGALAGHGRGTLACESAARGAPCAAVALSFPPCSSTLVEHI